MSDNAFRQRLEEIRSNITLPDNFTLQIGHDDENDPGRFYLQIRCWRMDVITKEMGHGYGGKAYLSPHATESELVQTAFGLYKGYLEHEARETFEWRGRRVFGPHMDVNAVWEIARRVDVRSAQHVEDTPKVIAAAADMSALDEYGDLLGPVASLADLDAVPTWEGAMQRTLRAILEANDGYIEDAHGTVVWPKGDRS